MKEEFDHRNAIKRLRFNVLDVVYGGERDALETARDAAAHLIRRQSAVGPDDADDGNANFREDVLRCSSDRQHSENEQQQRQNDEGIGSAQGHLNNPHLYAPPLSVTCIMQPYTPTRFKNATTACILLSAGLQKGALDETDEPGQCDLPDSTVTGCDWRLVDAPDRSPTRLPGVSRFIDFQKSLGLAKNILSERLRTLVANGVLEKRPSAGRGAVTNIHLTEKGRRLRVVLIALRQWGEDNLFAAGEPMVVASDHDHRPIARLRLMNEEGRALEPEEIITSRGRKASTRASVKARSARDR